MTTTITATPQPATASVLLEVTDDTTPAAFSLLRSDVTGIRPVRLYPLQDLDSGSLIVTDYEAALTGPIIYTVATESASASTTTTLDVDADWLNVPVAPQHSEQLELVTGLTEASEAMSTAHKIIDREDTVLTLRPLRNRAGTLELWCSTYAKARAVRAVYNRGEVVLYRQSAHPGLDMYHAATGKVSVEPAAEETTPRRWVVRVEFTEQRPPSAPLMGALGWNYGADLERNPTYAASALEFPTYADRLIGPAE